MRRRPHGPALGPHEHVGVTPDVLTCAKALGGGVPIGAMLCADVVRFVPPLVVKAEQVDAALGILEECLAEA